MNPRSRFDEDQAADDARRQKHIIEPASVFLNRMDRLDHDEGQERPLKASHSQHHIRLVPDADDTEQLLKPSRVLEGQRRVTHHGVCSCLHRRQYRVRRAVWVVSSAVVETGWLKMASVTLPRSRPRRSTGVGVSVMSGPPSR